MTSLFDYYCLRDYIIPKNGVIREKGDVEKMQNDKFGEIQNAFTKYLEKADKLLIKDFTIEEIEDALVQFYRDEGRAPYKAMVKRLEELKEKEKYKQEQIEKWKDRIIGFFLGLISGYLLSLLNGG